MMPRRILLLPALLGCLSCHDRRETVDVPQPDVRFAVLSDLHFHDAALLGEPPVEERDGALVRQSKEILEAIVAELRSESLGFVLVSGDLTRDGEAVNHDGVRTLLAQLKVPIYVIPGNHDLENPEATSYLTSPPSSVDSLTREGFRGFYADFGYTRAIARDPDSLSYVAEPTPSLRILAIDSTGPAHIGGRIGRETHEWLLARAEEAKRANRTMIALMHHGIVEHFTSEALVFPSNLVHDYLALGQLLALRGVRLVFSGHVHVNDVTTRKYSSSTLTDCETASPVFYPPSYRMATFSPRRREVTVETRYVLSTTQSPDLALESLAECTAATRESIYRRLTGDFGLPETTAPTFAEPLMGAFLAHAEGDEPGPGPAEAALMGLLRLDGTTLGRQYARLLEGLLTDPAPADNLVKIPLGIP
jgi:3',5'-cyclic AMP phosphodiesterase CpdA